MSDPLHKSAVVCGDFNFDEEENNSVILSSELKRFSRHHSADNKRALSNALSPFVQASCDMHTHFHKRSNSLNSIDKVFFCAPSWLILLPVFFAAVERSPVALSDAGLSDDAPLYVSFSLRGSSKDAGKVIPSCVCQSPRFRKPLDTYCNAAALDELPDSIAIPQHKAIIKEVAKIVRNESHLEKELSLQCKIASLSALARVVSYNKVALAEK